MSQKPDYKELLKQHHRELSNIQREVANFFLENPQEVALKSIHELARELNVGSATIVRLAKSLGYRGFAELKFEISENLRRNFAPVERFRRLSEKLSQMDSMLEIIARNEVKNIDETLNRLDRKTFKKAVRLILGAEHIYTMGLGVSSFLAQITTFLLSRIMVKATVLVHGSLNFLEQVIAMNRGDVLMAFSLPPYSRETVEAAEFARQRQVKILAFTNKMIAPIVPVSDIVILVRTDSPTFTNSIGAMLVVINALAAEVALQDEKKMNEALGLLQKVRDAHEFDFIDINVTKLKKIKKNT